MTLAETELLARNFWSGINNIAEQLRRGERAPTMPVRTFLALFGAQRRGYSIVQRIRSALQAAGLVTVPDFESAYIDSSINFALASDTSGSAQVELTGVEAASAVGSVDVTIAERLASSTIYADPTYRISKLAAANNKPVAITPDSTLQEAVTIMLRRDFSQLPVMTGERDVKGVISWISIGARASS